MVEMGSEVHTQLSVDKCKMSAVKYPDFGGILKISKCFLFSVVKGLFYIEGVRIPA
jgi:hypothetical protein